MQLFIFQTSIAKFAITTDDSTFVFSGVTYGFTYDLLADDDLIATFKSPFDASCRVAEHRTGYPPWDDSKERVPIELAAWTCQVSDANKLQVLNSVINSGASYRQIVDYFHHKHPYLLSRSDIKAMILDMAVTGQLERLPSSHMVPAELVHAAWQIKQWWDLDKKSL